MLTLYKYLRESIFDDDDILTHDSDKEIISNNLNQVPNEYFGIDNGGDHRATIKGNNLYVNSGTIVVYPGFDDLAKYVDTVHAYGLNLNQYVKNGGDFSKFKTINCASIYNSMYTSHIEFNNVDINVYGARFIRELLDKEVGSLGRHFRTSTTSGTIKCCCNTLKFENVNINFDKDTMVRQIRCDIQTFPDFSGLKTNVWLIKLYSPGILKKPETIKYLDKVFDHIGKTEEIGRDLSYGIVDAGKPKPIKNFKHIYAIVNNPKKYGIFSSRFQINPNISLKDVFPWIKNMPELRSIAIMDNNIMVRFINKEDPNYIDDGGEHVFSKDGWSVDIIKLAGS